MRTYVKDLKKYIGKEVLLSGFAETIRIQSKIQFIILRDVSGKVQLVIFNNDKAKKVVGDLSHESVIEVLGRVKEEKQAPGGFEIEVKNLEVLSASEPILPIPVVEKAQDETELDKRLDWRFLDLRKETNILAYKIWTELEHGFREYFLSNDFIQIHTPKFMDAPSESGAEVFRVDYFKEKAYLAQSPQFYKQMAMAAGFEKVFEINPVFRAEPSFTARHSTEITMMDFETSYIKSEEELMDYVESLIIFGVKKVSEKYGKEIKRVYEKGLIIPKKPFPRVTMEEAKKLLKSFKIKSDKEGDLNQTEENKLSEIIKEKHGSEFVFITDYPIGARPFYHMRREDKPKLTKSFDLLWDGIEVATGSLREHRHDVLVSQAKEKGLDPKSIKHYLEFFSYGVPPHGGAGMGPARMIMKICGFSNIREAMFLYRGVKRLSP